METKTLVDLNTAEVGELTLVPGIGPMLAERIVAARPFASFDDVQRVPGIEPSTLDKIAPYATVGEALWEEASPAFGAGAVERLGFVDIAPVEVGEEQHLAEIPADLI
ncbi:MAG TPA: helix-hairpin-helix domain-containing protein, partial [Anaerolineales bacterium]|nr:helix-hairpin-helix domain-containing protein [Anaerolineales bacterium]